MKGDNWSPKRKCGCPIIRAAVFLFYFFHFIEISNAFTL